MAKLKNTSELFEYLPSSIRDKLSQDEEHIDNLLDSEKILLDEYRSFEDLEIGIAIKLRRKQQGLSERELSELADVSRSTIQKLESGSKGVTLKNLRKVMSAVGLELAWR
jgi:predicted transcriptional regulator